MTQRTICNIQGAALLEATVAFLFLLPLGIVAAGTWDLVRQSSAVAEATSEAVARVKTASTVLRNEEGVVRGIQDSSAIRSIADRIVADVESSLIALNAEGYRIDAVIFELVSEGEAERTKVIYRTARQQGMLQADDPFARELAAPTQRAVSAELTNLVPSTVLVGVAVTANPTKTFYNSLLETIGYSPAITQKKVLRLRGEFAWAR